MFVIVIHRIHDRDGFDAAESRAIAGGLPRGVALTASARSPDHRVAFSICEGGSVTTVRDVVGDAMGLFADCEYYEMTVVAPTVSGGVRNLWTVPLPEPGAGIEPATS